MRTLFEAEALIEYEEAAEYAEEHFGVGRQFVAAVQAALASIEKAPTRFQAVGQGIRIYRMKRYPFHIFYHFDPDTETLVIYAIAHHKRRTDYWRDRLPEQ